MKPFFSDEDAKQAKAPETFRGYEVVVTGHVVIYDDIPAADALAKELGSYAKHSKIKRNPFLTTFSIVKLP